MEMKLTIEEIFYYIKDNEYCITYLREMDDEICLCAYIPKIDKNGILDTYINYYSPSNNLFTDDDKYSTLGDFVEKSLVLKRLSPILRRNKIMKILKK